MVLTLFLIGEFFLNDVIVWLGINFTISFHKIVFSILIHLDSAVGA